MGHPIPILGTRGASWVPKIGIISIMALINIMMGFWHQMKCVMAVITLSRQNRHGKQSFVLRVIEYLKMSISSTYGSYAFKIFLSQASQSGRRTVH